MSPRGSAAASSKADLLAAVPLFAGLSRAARERLGRLMDEVDVAAGTVVIREGNTGGEFFIVVDGSVGIRKGSRRVRTLGPGDFFGEIALIDKGPRSASVIVEEPAHLLVLSSREFHSMLASDQRIENTILRTLASRVRELRPADAY